MMRAVGEMPEWPNGTDSKSVVLVTVPRVQIPISPPLLTEKAPFYGAFSYLPFSIPPFIPPRRCCMKTSPQLQGTDRRNSLACRADGVTVWRLPVARHFLGLQCAKAPRQSLTQRQIVAGVWRQCVPVSLGGRHNHFLA